MSALIRRRWAIALLAVAIAAVVVAYPFLTAPRSPLPTPSPLVAQSSPTPVPTGGTTSPPTETPTATPTRLAPPDQQVLRVYCCSTDPRHLRPQEASGWDELSIINSIHRGLLYRDGEGNLVPSLATTLPTVSEDGLTYTYNLREDARYSDGTSIVAADIVRAARALADPRNSFNLGFEICYVEGAHDLLGTDLGCPDGDTPYLDRGAGTFDDDVADGLLDRLGVTALDEHTVQFRLYERTSFWPDITAMWLLTPVHPSQTSWLEAGEIVSSGPFMIDSWRHNFRIDLVPNPHWYGLAPTLSRIEINVGVDPVAAVAAWERGDLDLVRVPSSEIGRIDDMADYASMINRSSMLTFDHYDFANCLSRDAEGKIACPVNDAVTKGVIGGSPTQNFRFRQALTQAIDKTDMIENAFDGIGLAAYSPTMPGIPGFPTVSADTTPLPHDPAAALASMAIALEELGVAEPDPQTVLPASDTCDSTCQHTIARAQMLGPMKFGFTCDSGHDVRVLYLANQWRQLFGFTGPQMDIRCTDFGCCRTDRFTGNIYDIERRGWNADFDHPDNQNRDLFTCGARFNSSKYCNPAYDTLLNRGAAAETYGEAFPFYRQAEQTLVEDAPVLFLRYGETINLVRPWVTNYIQTPSDHQNVGDTFYETIQIEAH